MPAAIVRPAAEIRIDEHAHRGGGGPSAAAGVIKVEAKRAAWIYPACWAAGVLGTALLQILEPARF